MGYRPQQLLPQLWQLHTFRTPAYPYTVSRTASLQRLTSMEGGCIPQGGMPVHLKAAAVARLFSALCAGSVRCSGKGPGAG